MNARAPPSRTPGRCFCRRTAFPFPPATRSPHSLSRCRLGLHYPALMVGLIFCALSVAASRVILGLHYLSDVVAGMLIGILIGMAAFEWIHPSMKTAVISLLLLFSIALQAGEKKPPQGHEEDASVADQRRRSSASISSARTFGSDFNRQLHRARREDQPEGQPQRQALSGSSRRFHSALGIERRAQRTVPRRFADRRRGRAGGEPILRTTERTSILPETARKHQSGNERERRRPILPWTL